MITVIHFTRYYDHMYQEKSATLELVNSRGENEAYNVREQLISNSWWESSQ